MAHFNLNQLVKGMVSKCSHLLSPGGKGLNTRVWGQEQEEGRGSGRGMVGGAGREGGPGAGQQGAPIGAGAPPSPSQGGWTAYCVRGTRGEPEKRAAVPVLAPS